MDKKADNTNMEKVFEKAKKRTWKTVVGIGLNAAGGALIANPNIYVLLAGVALMGIGSALLAWDDGEEVEKDKNNKQNKIEEKQLKKENDFSNYIKEKNNGNGHK